MREREGESRENDHIIFVLISRLRNRSSSSRSLFVIES